MAKERHASDLNSSYHGKRPRHAAKHAKHAKANPRSREFYGSNAQRPVVAGAAGSDFAAPFHGRKRRKHVVLKAVVALVVIMLLVAVTAAVLYFHRLDSILQEQEYQQGSAERTLTEAFPDEPFYMLVLGSDSRGGADSDDVQYSDVIMLIRMDISKKQFTIVSIPRDTIWKQPDGTVSKINAAYNTGVRSSVQAISDLAGVPIAHYLEVDITDLESIVDMVGGVEVYVPTSLAVTDIIDATTITLEEGEQRLDGRQAQAFVRARHELESGESGRQSHVREVVQAVIESLLACPRTELPDMVLELAEYMHTDLRSHDIISMGMSYLFSPEQDVTIYNASAPSNGDFIESLGGEWYCFENPEGWATLMSLVDSGANPSGIDYESTQIVP